MDDYYPFGLTFNSSQPEMCTEQNYLYNGKELQDELELGWLDYGARMYMPEIGKWSTIDPHARKYEIVTPYNYAFSNPILFIDPNGKDNVIYLIADGSDARKQIRNIANEANAIFKKLKLNTKVIVFDESKRGKFNENKIDKTDNWAIVGTDRKSIRIKAESISSDESYETAIQYEWQNNSGHPEISNIATGGKGIVVDYNDGFAESNKDEQAGLFIIHGAAHSTKEISSSKNRKGQYGHLDQGIMQDGPDLQGDYMDKYRGMNHILAPNKSSVLKGNETYLKAMRARYGSNVASDNYNKKK